MVVVVEEEKGGLSAAVVAAVVAEARDSGGRGGRGELEASGRRLTFDSTFDHGKRR